MFMPGIRRPTLHTDPMQQHNADYSKQATHKKKQSLMEALGMATEQHHSDKLRFDNEFFSPLRH